MQTQALPDQMSQSRVLTQFPGSLERAVTFHTILMALKSPLGY